MKKSTEVIILAGLLAAALIVPNVSAQEGPDGPRGGPPSAERREKMEKNAAKQLGLSEEQQQQMKAIGEEQRTALEAIRNDESLSVEQRREKGRELMKTFQEKRDAVLTPEQKTKADELRKKARGHMKERRADRQGPGGPGGPGGPRGPGGPGAGPAE